MRRRPPKPSQPRAPRANSYAPFRSQTELILYNTLYTLWMDRPEDQEVLQVQSYAIAQLLNVSQQYATQMLIHLSQIGYIGLVEIAKGHTRRSNSIIVTPPEGFIKSFALDPGKLLMREDVP